MIIQQKRTRYLLLIASCLIVIFTKIAPAAVDVVLPENDHGNRWEGDVNYTVSSSFRVIACHIGVVPNFSPNDELDVMFYVPDEALETHVTARQFKRSTQRYGMLAKQTKWGNGWQAFNHWKVSDVLAPKSITSQTLGILVYQDDGNCLPAEVGVNENRRISNTITYYFHTPIDIIEINWTLLNGEKEIDTGLIRDIWGPDIFPISFELPKEYQLQEFKLIAAIEWPDGNNIYTYPFVLPQRTMQ